LMPIQRSRHRKQPLAVRNYYGFATELEG